MIFGPIIILLMAVVLILTSIGGALGTASQGGVVCYDENRFQDYADTCYAEEFGNSATYEDHILIAVLVDPENCSDFYYIAWVGDHVATDINMMFGGNGTELGRAMLGSVNESSYKYSLDSNLAAVMEIMTQKVTALGLDSSFKCSESREGTVSHLTNKSSVSLTDATVNDALTAFTDATGISVVIVVDEMEDVFGRTMPANDTFFLVIGAILLILGVFLIVKTFKRRGADEHGGYDSSNRNNDNDRF